MSKVRLVAYRKNQTSDQFDSTFELDLQEAPNISLNYQFADIREPEKRKANYSQTFKLPFTKPNNKFFQNWYEVNLATLMFNTRTRFNAVLYVGTVPQFEGVMQLRAVYQKGGYYEVVLMSNSADLFNIIGNNLLRDVFRYEDNNGVPYYSYEFNHTYNASNLSKSWDGSATDFYAINDDGSQGASLRDADGEVQKVVYPMSITAPKFYYLGSSSGQYLNLTQAQIDAFDPDDLDEGDIPPMYYTVPITQFRPAIQLKALIKLILARAGFSYTSTFIDKTSASGGYFCKLYMTTGNHTQNPCPQIVNTAGQATGSMIVGSSQQNFAEFVMPPFANFSTCVNDTPTNSWNGTDWMTITADTTSPATGYTTPYDPYSLWDTTTQTFTKTDHNQLALKFRYVASFLNFQPVDQTNCEDCACAGEDNDEIKVHIRLVDTTGNVLQYRDYDLDFSDNVVGMGQLTAIYFDDYISLIGDDIYGGVQLNQSVSIQVKFSMLMKLNSDNEGFVKLGAAKCIDFADNTGTCDVADYIFSGLYNEISCAWDGYDSNVYGQVVNIPFCIDDKLTQKSFLKDIIERFNLVIVPDPDDQTNLIIEPYDDYLSAGTQKFWTDKLDLDKEIIVKDTTSIQKRQITFSDLEDNDLMNKSIKEELPDYNVYGNINIRDTNNEFASGQMKNNPVFAPYINQKVFASNDDSIPTNLGNMAVQYEYSYKKVETGYENELPTTKPKLFYYSGIPTPILGTSSTTGSTAATIHLHQWTYSANLDPEFMFGTWTAHAFTTYPLCTPYEVTASATTGQASLTNTTNSLYWNQAPPLVPDLLVFTNNPNTTLTYNSLYFTYWSQYLNQIYSDEARIMECYLNLNEVDIFNFNFNDELFIKNAYWRVLNISNYQVGGQASTKVTLLKAIDVYAVSCTECDYVVADNTLLQNIFQDTFVWCPSTDPDCSFSLPLSLFTSQECCECAGGGFIAYQGTSATYLGLGICKYAANSLSIPMQNVIAPRGFTSNNLKSIISGKIEGLNYPMLVGTNRTKFSNSLLPLFGNDVIIKYASKIKEHPQLSGESHRLILSGFTIGNTRGYAYPEGDAKSKSLTMPDSSNVIIRVKGISTVVSGNNATYPIGTTEAFAYYTAFKKKTIIEQLGTAGGVSEFSLKESGASGACTLYIAIIDGAITFGLNDSQTDTNRIWELSVDMDVNQVFNMKRGWQEKWALWQNYRQITLQDGNYLIWN